MDDIFGVEVLQTFDNFIDQDVDELRVESVFVPFDEVEKVVLEVLENEVYFSFFFEGLFDTDDELSFEHFEHFDLSLDSFFAELVFIGLLEFFDCDSLCG